MREHAPPRLSEASVKRVSWIERGHLPADRAGVEDLAPPRLSEASVHRVVLDRAGVSTRRSDRGDETRAWRTLPLHASPRRRFMDSAVALEGHAPACPPNDPGRPPSGSGDLDTPPQNDSHCSSTSRKGTSARAPKRSSRFRRARVVAGLESPQRNRASWRGWRRAG